MADTLHNLSWPNIWTLSMACNCRPLWKAPQTSTPKLEKLPHKGFKQWNDNCCCATVEVPPYMAKHLVCYPQLCLYMRLKEVYDYSKFFLLPNMFNTSRKKLTWIRQNNVPPYFHININTFPCMELQNLSL